MYGNLTEYIARLEKEGELVRIGARVDPVLEIAEITDRESKKHGGGRALLFENTGTEFPVITNMMGSDRRIAMALGVNDVNDLTAGIDKLFAAAVSPKPAFSDKLSMLPLLGKAVRWFPKNKRGKGECQQVILTGADADLGMLPILKCWPYDGGRFVTLPLVNTLDPETGVRNVGMYRMQVFSANTTGMHWHLHKTGERHYQGYRKLGKRMPVSVCLGGDPAYTYAATAPLPDNLDEYLLAGFLRGRPVELVKCVTNDIRVPADCDFVIEGYVDPVEEKAVEGPFGDHTGFYSLEDRYPVFHVTAITHRHGAVYTATIVGVPPQEDAYISKATERLFLSPIRMLMLPEIEDMYMPQEGVSHNLVITAIKKTFPGQGFKTANMMWGAGQMMFNKFLVVTSGIPDIRNAEAIRECIRRVRIPQDILFSRGPLDILDHAAPESGFGGKMAFDLTNIDPEENVEKPRFPEKPITTGIIDTVETHLADQWSTLIIKVGRSNKNATLADITENIVYLIEHNEICGIKFCMITDTAFDTTDLPSLLWFALANTDPSRDVEIADNILIFDTRIKAEGVNGSTRPWPNIAASSPQTIATVDKRWNEYHLGEFRKSPSLKYTPLNNGNAEYKR